MAHRGRADRLRFGVGLLALFLATVWVSLALWAVVPAVVLGWDPITLTGGSMGPRLAVGDVVVASPHRGMGLGQGSVVVFPDPAGPGVVTHRIVSLTPDGQYLTQGDANAQPDSTPLAPDDILGVGRLRVPFVGLPLVWAWSGAWLKLAGWIAVTAAALWCSRWALLRRFEPAPRAGNRPPPPVGDDSSYQRHRQLPSLAGRLRRARTTIVPLAAVVLFLAASTGTAARAVFSSASANDGNSLLAASSFGSLTIHLHNYPTPPVGDTASQSVLPMDFTPPTATVLYNYDTDRDAFPGLLLAKAAVGQAENDPTKHQFWSMTTTQDLVLSGQVTLTIWSSMKDFEPSKKGQVNARLMDCATDGSGCVIIANQNATANQWNGGIADWVSRTINLGSVSHTVASDRALRLRLVVANGSGDDMWFAYDTTSYAGTLQVG